MKEPFLKNIDAVLDRVSGLEPIKDHIWFTNKEFGLIVGASRQTVASWVREGYLKATKFDDRSTRKFIHISELERYKEGRMMEKRDVKDGGL